jgi:hypothetical protein
MEASTSPTMIQMSKEELQAMLDERDAKMEAKMKARAKREKKELEDQFTFLISQQWKHTNTSQLVRIGDSYSHEIDVDDYMDGEHGGKPGMIAVTEASSRASKEIDEELQPVSGKPLQVKDTDPEKAETEEGEWHAPFGESIYTLLYMCPPKSQGFWYAGHC